MKKIILILLLSLLPIQIFAEDSPLKNIDKDSIFYNWEELKKETDDIHFKSLEIEFVENMSSFNGFKEFLDKNFDEIVSKPNKYNLIWKRILVTAENDFIRKISKNEKYDIEIRNWAKVQISEDIKELDEIYNYYKLNKDNKSMEYTKKQALYTLFNKSASYELFKTNLKMFKYIDAKKAFNDFFPDHLYLLKLKEENRLKKEAIEKKQKKIEHEIKVKKQLKMLGIFLLSIFIFFIILIKFLKIKKNRANRNLFDETRHQSFTEILSNAKGIELLRIKEREIFETIENIPSLNEILLPFAREFKIPFEDMVLINLYIQKSADKGDSQGLDKLKGTCSDYSKNIVYTTRENDEAVLMMKDIY